MTGPAMGTVSTTDLRGPATDFPRDALLHELFIDCAGRNPNAPAVRHRGRELSYAEVDRRSRELAVRLLTAGVRRGDAVGVCGSRSAEAVIAFLGVLRAGCAYVPMDDDLPPARINAMAEDAGVRVAVVLPGSVCRVRRLAARIDLGTAGPPSPQQLPAADTTADECAYVMFTSGSTGRPKPVAVPHRGVVRLAASDPRLPRPGVGDRVLHGYSPSSDASTIEIWSALVGGACLVVVDREELLSPEALHRRLREEDVDIAYLTTSVFHHVARTVPEAFAVLDFVSAGGEAMDPGLARAVLRTCPNTEVVNFYGPTENTVVSTFHPVSGLDDEARSVPIGTPLANSSCRVLRSDGTIAEIGEEGELLVGGDGLALGYLGDARLTDERFVELPDGERFYRTGDRALLDREGRLEYRGRMDRQVKIRGHRIEPDEVEARLRAHPDVADAVVQVRSAHLEAHIVPADPGRGIETAGLRGFCASWLPAAAVPRAFHTWESFPVSVAGKVDRARLAAEAAVEVEPVPPGPEGGVNSVRDGVVSAWRATVGVTPEPGDDFFLIGGDSLLAAEAVNRTRAALGVGAEHGSALIRALIERPELEEFTRSVGRLLSGSVDVAPETSTDFEVEARLGLDLPPQRGPAPDPGDPAEVLLTGATGFVGAYLLDRLLSRTGARVHCPVRARDAQHAHRRVLANLARYGLSAPGDQDRLVCFPADLGAERLGLDESHAAHLADRLDLILHSGARVNFVYPYSALRATNVEATRELVRLSAPRRVPVHFLSTIAVLAGFGSAGVGHVAEDTPLAYADRLTMGYAESKWVAERMLGEAGRSGLPVTVYRPYEITGDRESGICNTETAICSMFKMIAETGVAPDMDLPMDFVPVDHLVDTILHVATGSSPPRPVYHLTNPRPARLSDVVRRMRAAGCRIRTLSYQDWVTELVRHVAEDPTSPTAPFVSLCVDRGRGTDLSVKELYLEEVFPGLGRANAEAAVAEAGLTCPPVDDALIDRYLDFMFGCGFIRRPSRVEPVAVAHAGTALSRGRG
ncbi:amino acid adenylation domain-containing SDR family oxidoreductase [Nocardiopsis ganjiahuensis]|uniref:amino acid adenylation domain-containing SDR family oxidoreductase n=1 Tax=Nocardiopsis ganjiahuensis TaxID=239984 RepID=UPI000375D2DF|nr:amino acid adenylation domain-containing SDR family oxidoreductase [Nocardiopsis ganjiahuensis]